MILLAGLAAPPRELCSSPWAPLGTPAQLRRLGPGPHTILAQDTGARQLARWVSSPEALAELGAVLLVNPQLAAGEKALLPWAPAVLAAARGELLLAIWASHLAPIRRGQRHPYDLAYLFHELAQQAPPPELSAEITPRELRAWPPGEVLCGELGSWSEAPQLSVQTRGGLVCVLDLSTPEADEPEELARLYAPGALVRGVLDGWAMPAPRPTVRSAARSAAVVAGRPRRKASERAREAAGELSELTQGGRAVGRAVGEAAVAVRDGVVFVKELWKTLKG